MEMLLNHNNLLISQSVERQYDLQNVNGISFIYAPSDSDDERLCYNVLDRRNEIITKVFEIGHLIEKNIKDDEYSPNFTRRNLLLYRSSIVRLADERYLFFLDGELKESLLEMAYTFTVNFGTLGLMQVNKSFYRSTIMACRDFLEENDISAKPYSITPVGFMLDELYNFYYHYKYPKKSLKKINETLAETHVKVHSTSIFANLQVVASYDGISQWNYMCYSKTLLDGIAFILISFASSNSEYIKQCAYCDKHFITNNERSIYCSPTCRNRINVKKSYEKRKLKIQKDSE